VSDIIGEILQVAGVQKDVEKFVKYLGYPERPTALTDLVMVGICCVVGIFVGLIMVGEPCWYMSCNADLHPVVSIQHS